MKNLKPYNGDTYLDFENAINRKRNSAEKNNLLNYKSYVKIAYRAYKKEFDANNLHLVKPNNYCKIIRNELISLYGYQKRIIRDIRDNIKNQQILTIQTTCQNCTIDMVGTMDHILPKDDYPELAINGYNLFPCCNTCNQYKNDSVSSISGKKFLNLFLDILPNIQYLFVDVYLTNGNIDFRFYLKNKNKVDSQLYVTLENHYKKLHLYNRMKDASRSYLSDFISSLKPHFKRSGKEYVKDTVTESVEDKRNAYGYNYWKCILEESLLKSPIFWNYLQQTCF